MTSIAYILNTLPIRVIPTDAKNTCNSAHEAAVDIRCIKTDMVGLLIHCRNANIMWNQELHRKFKRFCDKARIALGEPRHESRLWELGFNDTILQREGQLDNMLRYLQQNPYRLWTKRNHPDFFTVQHDVDIMGQTISVMGNRFLLDHPDRVMVQCSRRLTEQQIAQAVEHFVSLAGDGVVLVSACISPGEKAVMRAAFECGARQIILVENGFSPHWKPGGAQFDACARGQILLVAPWPHHNERVSITREQCLQLNALASAISQCD